MVSERELLQKAWQALLRGDTAERDRLCDLATHIHNQRIRLQEGGSLMPGEPIKLVEGKDGVFVPEV